jgi:hypothetical protein
MGLTKMEILDNDTLVIHLQTKRTDRHQKPQRRPENLVREQRTQEVVRQSLRHK